MEKLKDLGFKELYRRDVPLGAILNKETANNFEIIPTGSYIDENNNCIIPSVLEPHLFHVIPPTTSSKYFELSIYNGAKSIDEIINYFKILKIED